MRRSLWIFIGLVALTIVACRRRPVFKPLGYRWPVKAGEVASWKQSILPGNDLQSHFEIFTKGVTARKVGGQSIPSILVRLACTNDTPYQLTLDAAETHVVDNQGRIQRNSLALANGDVSVYTRMHPKSHTLLDLYYDLPRGVGKGSIKRFTFHWRYKVGAHPYQQASIFQRGYYAD